MVTDFIFNMGKLLVNNICLTTQIVVNFKQGWISTNKKAALASTNNIQSSGWSTAGRSRMSLYLQGRLMVTSFSSHSALLARGWCVHSGA